MCVRLPRAMSMALAAVCATGCGSGGSGVDLPALEIRTSTTGTELDPDGYGVTVDGDPPRAMGLVDSLIVDPLADGPHSVNLGGLADNCAVSGGPTVIATVESGKTATVAYAVVCGATHGRIVITTATSGDDLDADGYQIQVDDTGQGPIGLNDSLPIGGVPPGDHEVTLGGVAANCSVDGDNPRPVSVTAGGEASVAFAVRCILPVGHVRVEVISSGAPPDPDGYTVSLDRAAPGVPIAVSDTVDLGDVPVGSHSITLSGLASNCTLQSANPVEVEVPLGGSVTAAFAVACLGDSQVIAFTANAPGLLGVFLVSPDGSGLAQLTPDTLLERDPVWSPDGRRLLVVRVDPSFQSEALYVMNPDGSGRTKLAESASLVNYRWSPDGSRIAFSLGQVVRGNLVSDLWVMGADGSGKMRVATNAEGPTWSPDGRLIAFVRDVGDIHIRIANLDAGVSERLTPDSLTTIQPAWSPDGSRIAFVSNRAGGFPELYLMFADGSGLVRLTTNSSIDANPSWSPDGTRLLFERCCDNGTSDLLTIDVATRAEANLTSSSTQQDFDPVFSPDGTRIAFVSFEIGQGNLDVWVMNADGTAPMRMTQEAGPDLAPHWQPIPA